MNNTNIKRILIVMSLTLLGSACGGSGSNHGTSARNVSGVWTGALTKVSDTCPGSHSATLNFSHDTSQNEGAVTLTENGSITYLGNLVGENGFSVDAVASTTIDGDVCQDSNRIEYDQIDSNDDSTGSLNFQVARECPGSSCIIAYTGTASRSIAAATSTATPIPGSTATPGVVASGEGCSEINPRTKSGTYLGDGQCGISSVNYSSSSTVVTLEPFGVNGATSFAIDSTNSSAAISNRTDLTIKGIDGYSCSIACSAPSTFTAHCIKEGGTSCVEKF